MKKQYCPIARPILRAKHEYKGEHELQQDSTKIRQKVRKSFVHKNPYHIYNLLHSEPRVEHLYRKVYETFFVKTF